MMGNTYDLKFGTDPSNDVTKEDAYRDISKQNGGTYKGELRIPSDCNDCELQKNRQEIEEQKFNNALDKAMKNGPKILPPMPGGRMGPLVR